MRFDAVGRKSVRIDRSLYLDVDARAETPQDIEKRGARRIDADMIDLDPRTGNRGGGDEPERLRPRRRG